MKRIAAFLFASVMIVLSSCSKENQAGKVNMSKLAGTWVESYADDPLANVYGRHRVEFEENGLAEGRC